MPKKKKKPPKKRKRKTSNKFFSVGKICIECKWEYQIYSKRMEIKRAKVKGRGRDWGRMILRLKAVKKWKWGGNVGGNVIVRYKINKEEE